MSVLTRAGGLAALLTLSTISVGLAQEEGTASGGAVQAEHDLEHEEGERDFTEVATLDHRLIVTYDGGVATLDTASGDVIDNHDIPGFLRLNAVGDGRHVLVTTGEGWEVFDVGLDAVEHGDHYHYYEAEPHWPGVVFGAETPAHVVTHAGLTALFDDGTGQVTLFDPNELGGDGEVETDTSYSAPEAHHGVAVPLAGDELIVTVGNADDRTGAALLDADHEVIAETDNCPGVHGETVAADDMVVIGCEDGAIILRGDHWHKVDGDVAETGYARSGNLHGTHVSPVVLGDYRPDPEEPMISVALIDTRDDSFSTVEVDAPYNFRGLARGPQSEALVLTESGALHIIDPESREITISIEGVVEEWVEPEAWQEPRPTLAVADEIAYVTEPATQQIHAVDIVGGDVLATYELDMVPNEIVVVTGFASEGSSEGHSDHDDHAHGTEGDHAHAEGTRLLVTDLGSSTASVLDLATGEVLGSFSTPGAAGATYASPSGRYGMVVHRDENRVSVIHSGLSLVDHGDHADLVQGNPYVLSTRNVGREPTHVWTHGDEIVIFNDADGTVAILDERIFGLSLEYTEVEVAEPDHGAAVMLGGTVLAGYYNLGRVDAYSRDGDLLETIEGCPGLHGEATLGDTAAFGCEDGVLLVHDDSGNMTTTKLENPAGTAEDVRVGTLTAHDEAGVFVGNFGDGLVWVNPEAETMNVIDTGGAPLRFAFDHEGEHVVALTADGLFHVLEADSGEVHGSVRVMEAVDISGGYGTYDAPSLAVGEGAVYVGVPAQQQIVEVHPEETEVARRIDVPGTPNSIAVLALEGGTVH